jgi:hypothetical protein
MRGALSGVAMASSRPPSPWASPVPARLSTIPNGPAGPLHVVWYRRGCQEMFGDEQAESVKAKRVVVKKCNNFYLINRRFRGAEREKG